MKFLSMNLIKLFLITLILNEVNVFAAGGGTSANSTAGQNSININLLKDVQPTQYRVVPFSDYLESQKLPPDLFVRFELKCYQSLVKVIREDIVDPATNKVSIVIGGLVKENMLLPCSNSYTTSDYAGPTFSGREFEVRSVE